MDLYTYIINNDITLPWVHNLLGEIMIMPVSVRRLGYLFPISHSHPPQHKTHHEMGRTVVFRSSTIHTIQHSPDDSSTDGHGRKWFCRLFLLGDDGGNIVYF